VNTGVHGRATFAGFNSNFGKKRFGFVIPRTSEWPFNDGETSFLKELSQANIDLRHLVGV